LVRNIINSQQLKEPAMRKPISTRVHGVIDYMTAGMLFTLPRVMGWSRNVTRLLDMAGGSAAGYSMFTKYEMGVVKALPMKAHLTMDAMSGAALIGAAAIMDEEDDEVRMTVAGIGLFEIAMSLLTRTDTTLLKRMENDESSRSASQMPRGDLSQQSMPVSPERSLKRGTEEGRQVGRSDESSRTASRMPVGDLSKQSMPISPERSLQAGVGRER